MTQRNIAKLIVGAVLCWGAILAIGAYFLNRNPARPAVVFGCVLLFLGAFIAVFRVSRRKLDEREEERLRDDEEAGRISLDPDAVVRAERRKSGEDDDG